MRRRVVAVGVVAAVLGAGAAVITATRPTRPPPSPIPREGDVRFKVTCNFDHSAHDDPVVFPDVPDAAHRHDFFGARDVDATTTTFEDLLPLPTTCNDPDDHAAYWAPSVYTADGPITPVRMTAYYRRGSKLGEIKPFPDGLKVIADWGPGKPSGFQCSANQPTIVPYDCPDDDDVNMTIDFPDCWDGVNIDSADHRSHMAYSQYDSALRYNVCPSTHPVQVPSIEINIHLDLADGTLITGLSSGSALAGVSVAPTSTMHADFFNGWDRARQLERIETCLNQLQRCDSGG